MKLKTPVSLMVAIVLGLVTAYFGVQTMHNSNGRSSPMTRVLVAKRDMTPGYVIQADDLESKVFSIDGVPDKAMHETKDAVGRTVIANIVTGQTMIDGMMAPKGGAGGLAAIIPAGMRATTIDVSDSSAVAGLLTPGSRVDVIAMLQKGDQRIVKEIVENVQVQSLQRGISGYSTVNGVSTANESGPVKTVTLLVNPKQANSIELAKSGSGSRLTLTLRGQGDATTADGTISEHELAGIADTTQPVAEPPAPKEDVFANTPPPAEDKGRPVQILRGGTETFIYMKDKGPDEEAAKATPTTKTPAPKSAGQSTPPDQEPQTASGTTAPELHPRVEERSNIR
jgi:pilus assembly protein CpaB